MATPHVTGAVALYYATFKKNTGAYPTNATAKAAVMSTGVAGAAYTVRLAHWMCHDTQCTTVGEQHVAFGRA